MDLFAIFCTTCNAKLKVRDAAAIGQILACPKCSSMVLVEAPPGWEPAVAGNAAQAKAQAVELHPSQSGILQRPSKPASDLPETADFGDADALLSNPPAAGTAASSIGQPAAPVGKATTAPEPVAPNPDVATSELPDSNWTANKSRVRILVGAIAGGVVLGLVCIAALVAMQSSDVDSDGLSARADGATDEVDSNKGDDPASSQAQSPIDSDPPADNVDPPDNPIPNDVEPADPPSDIDPTTTVAKNSGSPKPDPNGSPDVSAAPPGFEADKPDDVGATDADSVRDSLRQFAELIDGEPFDADAGSDAVALPDHGDPLPRPEPREIDVPARLADVVAGIEFADTPLVDLLQFMSEMTTIPITISPEALQSVNVSARNLVSVTQSNAPVGAVLDAILRPLKLGYRVDGGHVIVIARTAAADDGALSEVEYPVADLIGADAAELVDTVIALVAPTTWESTQGMGSARAEGDALIVRQTAEAHFELLVLLEKLRAARKLPPHSTVDSPLFKLMTRTESARAKLDAPITMNFVPPTRFVEIVARVAAEADATILIDWQALAAIGWTTDTELTFSVDAEPRHDALDKLLKPMELTYRVIDPATIQITTPLAILERPELEVHAAGDLLSGTLQPTALIEGLIAAVGPHYFLGGAGEIRFDSPSESLLVYLPQPQQVKVAKMLARLRESE